MEVSSGRSQEELLFSLIERAQNPTMVSVSHVSNQGSELAVSRVVYHTSPTNSATSVSALQRLQTMLLLMELNDSMPC